MRKLFRGIFVVNFLIEFSFCYFSSSFNAESDTFFNLRIRNRAFSDVDSLNFESKDKLDKTAFSKKKLIIFQVHGYLENSEIVAHTNLSKALLHAHDDNLFFVDWGKGARTLDYSQAKSRVYDVARILGNFMIFLHEKHGIDFKKISCIGFSLGAHICGNAGTYLEEKKILKIIGLDPAGPLFDVSDVNSRINADSAEYVECIHTGYPLGIRSPVCQADFFFNRGVHQPGCENYYGVDDKVCSHYRAIWYYIEALNKPEHFYGKSCTDFKNILSGNCNDDPGEYMGNKKNIDEKIVGIFLIHTNKESPFGRGRD